MSTNIHIYPSAIINESRILKITDTLRKNKVFDKIYIFGVLKEGLKAVEEIDETRKLFRFPMKLDYKKQNKWLSDIFRVLNYIQWSLKIIRKLQNQKIKCINCHSIGVLPLCIFLKFIKNAKLIYDIHELETETIGLRGFKKNVMKLIERFFIGFINGTFVVSESIEMWYRHQYKLEKVWTVRNIPKFVEHHNINKVKLRQIFNIPNNELIFLYQGVISSGRGINIILECFAEVKDKGHVIFMGYGDMVDKVKQFEKEYFNIHYIPAVPYDEIQNYTRAADVGISLIENVCLSYKMCLPNKIFEYLHCGLPVIISNLPEMKKIVDSYQCGWKCCESVYELTKIINDLSNDILLEKRENAKKVKENINWPLEEKMLLQGYKDMGCH